MTAATASGLTNWVADATSVAAVEKLVADFIKVLPTLESDTKALVTDIRDSCPGTGGVNVRSSHTEDLEENSPGLEK